MYMYIENAWSVSFFTHFSGIIMDEIGKDDRFSKIEKDPRFRGMPKKQRKVKIDKRFKDMFTDKKFKLKYSVDKRGRPIKSTTNENFRKYYDISESEEDDGDTNLPNENGSQEKDLETVLTCSGIFAYHLFSFYISCTD